MSAVDKKADAIAQFRADFKTVFAHYRASGELAQDEAAAQMREASAAVQDHLHDADWMACAAAHFRRMAAQIEHEKTRAKAIAADVRTKKLRTAA